MNYRKAFAAFLAAFIIQTTIAHHFALFGVTPNFILVLVISFTFLFEGRQGILFGIVFGLLQDILFSPVIGISALGYFIVALIVSEVRRYLYRDNILSVIFIAAGGTLVFALTGWGLAAMFGGIYDFLFLLGRLPLLILLNTICLLLAYWFLVRKVIKYRGLKYM